MKTYHWKPLVLTMIEGVMTTEKKIEGIDLFCGIGGLTHGLSLAGIDMRLGIDIDESCQYPYEENNSAQFLLKSVTDISPAELCKYYSNNAIRVLAGCAPCQTFSTYNPKANDQDERWWLLREFGRLASNKSLAPEIITMENVPGITDQNIFREFVEMLRAGGFSVSYERVDCSLYGIPQRRHRLVLLASKYGAVSLVSPSEFGRAPKTVRDAISSLSPLLAGESDPNDPIHKSARLSQLNTRRVRASTPGGTWRDWPPELVAKCHQKESGFSYSSVYARMEWDKPAPTITTQFYGFGNGRFGHPEQDRGISLREGATIQSFPPDYRFVPPGGTVAIGALGRMIGNAVPVVLGQAIGISIKKHVNEIYSSNHQ